MLQGLPYALWEFFFFFGPISGLSPLDARGILLHLVMIKMVSKHYHSPCRGSLTYGIGAGVPGEVWGEGEQAALEKEGGVHKPLIPVLVRQRQVYL